MVGVVIIMLLRREANTQRVGWLHLINWGAGFHTVLRGDESRVKVGGKLETNHPPAGTSPIDATALKWPFPFWQGSLNVSIELAEEAVISEPNILSNLLELNGA